MCRLVTIVSCAKAAEPVERPFVVWTRGAQGATYYRQIIGGARQGNGHFRVVINIVNVIRQGAGLMRLLAASLEQ